MVWWLRISLLMQRMGFDPGQGTKGTCPATKDLKTYANKTRPSQINFLNSAGPRSEKALDTILESGGELTEGIKKVSS